MDALPLSPAAKRLVALLAAADRQPRPSGQVFHVSSLAAGFYFAYEQLRNVAAYREQHLLVRSAIERFLARDVRLYHPEPIGADLVTELTQAGYLKNDTVPLTAITEIDDLMAKYSDIAKELGKHRLAGRDTVTKWIFQYASVRFENLIIPDARTGAVMQFAYEHYVTSIDSSATERKTPDQQQFRIALYCAVQRSLFKSNLPTIRYYCFQASLGELADQPVEHIAELNSLIDQLYQAPMTNRVARLVTRYGAPMRILREFISANSPGTEEVMQRRSETISRIKSLCGQQYLVVQKQLNSRIGKTILFILVTKTLIGMAVEIPYDFAVYSAISWTPLLLNIIFPVAYMATIGARIHTPSRQNTEVVASYVDRILYEGAGPAITYKPKRRIKSRSLIGMFSFVYAISFIGSIALLVYLLILLGFNAVNGTIFFVFLSAVSFLGFRLRQSAHELQIIDEREGLVAALIDFLSTPFVRAGQWISDKYAKANIVTFVLDLAIEMPLKTSLKVVRQWVGFMRDKQEEL